MPDDVDVIAHAARRLGADPGSAERCVSNNNSVYRLGSGLILKFSKDPARNPTLRQEAEICEYLLAAGLPVPPVLDRFEACGRQCIIYQRILGETGAHWNEDRQNWQTAGSFLPALFAARGELQNLGTSAPSHDQEAMLQRLAKHDLLDSGLEAAIGEMFSCYLDTRYRCFCHADYGPSQTLVDANGKLWVIDWERSGSSNILYSAGRFLAMIDEYGTGDKAGKAAAFLEGFSTGDLAGTQSAVAQLHLLSDLSDAHWKLVCGADHHRHALHLIDKTRRSLGLR